MLTRGACAHAHRCASTHVHGEAGGVCAVPLIQRDDTYMMAFIHWGASLALLKPHHLGDPLHCLNRRCLHPFIPCLPEMQF